MQNLAERAGADLVADRADRRVATEREAAGGNRPGALSRAGKHTAAKGN